MTPALHLPDKSERAATSDALTNDQCMNVVRSFVSLHGLQVHHVPHYRIFVGDPVGSEDVASHSRALQGHPNVVPLGHGDVLVLDLAGVFQASNLQRRAIVPW